MQNDGGLYFDNIVIFSFQSHLTSNACNMILYAISIRCWSTACFKLCGILYGKTQILVHHFLTMMPQNQHLFSALVLPLFNPQDIPLQHFGGLFQNLQFRFLLQGF